MTVAPESIASVRGEDAPLIQIKRFVRNAISAWTRPVGFLPKAMRRRLSQGQICHCKIKSRKQDGQTLNIVAGCATDIMLSNVQFSLKVLEPNRILRIFPGMTDVEIGYERCPL